MDLRKRPVSEIMHPEVVTLTTREKLDLTQDIMNIGRVRHLPVLDDDSAWSESSRTAICSRPR
jgi:CBS domain-containing protein